MKEKIKENIELMNLTNFKEDMKIIGGENKKGWRGGRGV